MADLPPFMRVVTAQDIDVLSRCWGWLVPPMHRPLLLSLMGDWVCAAPTGEHFALSVLEGDYRRIAASSSEFNDSKSSFEWLDENFQAAWQEIAHRHGLVPGPGECLAWRIPPVVGGPFEVQNLHVLSQTTYQVAMGQLHQQLQTGEALP